MKKTFYIVVTLFMILSVYEFAQIRTELNSIGQAQITDSTLIINSIKNGR